MSEKYEFEQEVFSTGKWNGDEYTDQDLMDMVNNFTELLETVKPPVKLGHDVSKWKDGLPALGWITGLRKEGSKLIAKLSDVPEIIHKAIKGKLYKRVSSEIYWNYKSPSGKVFKRVFAGLALLGADAPAVTNLQDLEVFLSDNPDAGTYEKVCTYNADDFNKNLKVNNNHGGTTMDDQIKKDYEDKLNAEKTAREKAEADKIKAESDLKAYKQQEADRITAEKKASSIADFYAFIDAEVKAFRMTPACADILKKVESHEYSDTGMTLALTAFKEYQAKVPAILDKKEFGSAGGAENNNYKNVQEEMDEAIKAYMAEHKASYADAMYAVTALNSDLAKRYAEDIPTSAGKEGE